MAHDADDPPAWDGERLLESHAPTAHPCVDLHMDVEPFRRVRGREGELEPGVAGRVLLAGGQGAHDQDPRRRERLSQVFALAGRRDAEAGRTTLERGPRSPDRPVPVRLGFHDRRLGGAAVSRRCAAFRRIAARSTVTTDRLTGRGRARATRPRPGRSSPLAVALAGKPRCDPARRPRRRPRQLSPPSPWPGTPPPLR